MGVIPPETLAQMLRDAGMLNPQVGALPFVTGADAQLAAGHGLDYGSVSEGDWGGYADPAAGRTQGQEYINGMPLYGASMSLVPYAMGTLGFSLTRLLGSTVVKRVVAWATGLGLGWMLLEPFTEGTALPAEIEQFVATILPGQQGGLGEAPGGLDQLGGRVIKTWRAGVAWFAILLYPTQKGFSYKRVVYNTRRGMWLPVRTPRNIVIGAKELRIASMLGHKRRVGKRRILQIIARPASMRRSWKGKR